MENTEKSVLFEQMPVPQAARRLMIPTILSSLVMVIYSMADTYFVGRLNNPIENSAVTLAAPVLLAFNAVNNLFGVGSSSMMSRALGQQDFDKVRKRSFRSGGADWTVRCTAACAGLVRIIISLQTVKRITAGTASTCRRWGTAGYPWKSWKRFR